MCTAGESGGSYRVTRNGLLAPRVIGCTADVARGGAPGWAGPFPWFEYHLDLTNHAQAPGAAPVLASRREGSSAGELIPELDTRGLQQLIELELAAFLGADWHERTEERLGHRNGYRPRTPTPTWVVRVGLRLACSFR